LVVVAIIGILATVVLASLSSGRASARDARRLADIKTIQTALELYNTENGKYPTTAWAVGDQPSWTTLENILGVNLPDDPLNTNTNNVSNAATAGDYMYAYFANNDTGFCFGRAYMIVANFETKIDTSPGVRFCNNATFGYGNSIVVGVNDRGEFIGPTLTKK